MSAHFFVIRNACREPGKEAGGEYLKARAKSIQMVGHDMPKIALTSLNFRQIRGIFAPFDFPAIEPDSSTNSEWKHP